MRPPSVLSKADDGGYNPLSEEEQAMPADTTTAKSWVQKTANVCGGDACIRNTRITVHGLVHYRQLGFSDQQLLEMIQGLTPDDVAAAWQYYAKNQAEIEDAIRLNEEA
jgi:uncharacterized protein (DUF433 family)